MKLRAALLLVSMLMAGKSYANPMFALPDPDPFYVGSFAFGEIFTVGPADILVTSLGAWDSDGDGFFTQGGIPVGIFQESLDPLLDDVLLESTLVESDDPLTDGFRYQAILPLVLFSGVQYRVVAVNRDDYYNVDLDFTVNPLITRTGYGYCPTRFLISCDMHTGMERIWMANFTAEPVDAQLEPVPEPASLILLGTGITAIYTRARRHRTSRSD